LRRAARAATVTRVALLAALYFTLTASPPFASFSYGPIQVRVAEALVVLPAVTADAVPALFLGCLAANLFGGLGPVDVVFGSLATLVAALVASRVSNPWLVPLPAIVVNAVVVGTYLPAVLGLPTPLWLSWAYIAAGETAAAAGLGLPLLFFLRRRPDLLRLLGGRPPQGPPR